MKICYFFIKRKQFCVVLLVFFPLLIFAGPGNFSWTGAVSTEWSINGNWTPTGVPSVNDSVTITRGSTVTLTNDVTIKKITLEGGEINLTNYALTITSQATFLDGTINAYSNGHLFVTAGQTTLFSGTRFNVRTTINSNSIFLNGSIFNDSLFITKTGNSNDNSKGGNLFTNFVSFTNAMDGAMVLADSFPDSFEKKLIVNNGKKAKEKGCIYLAHRATGNSFKDDVILNGNNIYLNYYGTANYSGNIILNCPYGDIVFGFGSGSSTMSNTKTILLGDSAFSAGNLILRHFIKYGTEGSLELSLTGSAGLAFESGTVFNSPVIVSAPVLTLHEARFNNSVEMTNTGTAISTSEGGAYFAGVTNITNNSSGTNSFALGNSIPDTFATTTTIVNTKGTFSLNNGVFNGNVIFKNYESSTNSDRFIIASQGSCTFAGNIQLQNTVSGFCFGKAGGTTTLAAGKTLLFTTGFTGNITLKNFTQLGATPQSFNFPSVGQKLIVGPGSTFNGNFTFTGRFIQLNGTTFNGSAIITRNNSIPDTSAGGNIFNSTTIIKDSSNYAGAFIMAYSNPDKFNSNVTFIQKGNGMAIYPAYVKNSTFAGNITINATSPFQFGGNGGKVILDGTGNQNLSNLSSSSITMKKLQINKALNSFTLLCPLAISDSLLLTTGWINTDTTNLLSLAQGSKLVGGSDISYINGPMKKTGNTAFVFATGSSALVHPYHPIEITAPSLVSDSYTANYFSHGQTIGTAIDTSIDNLNACEYWKLTRGSGTSTVKVKLTWNNDSCESISPTNYRATGWDGSKWKDLGNNSSSGDSLFGSIQSRDNVSTISDFTLAFHLCSGFRKTIATHNVTCKNSSDGYAEFIVKGGTKKYQYIWSEGKGTNYFANNLKAGKYFVQVSDSRTCNLKDSLLILEPETLSYKVSKEAATCGNNNGLISIISYGGIPPYHYFWPSSGDTTYKLRNILSGIYPIQIFDSVECMLFSDIVLNDEDGPGMNIISLTNPTCFGTDSGFVEIEGADGKSPYLYKWDRFDEDTLSTLNNIYAGSYPIQIINSEGCKSFDTIFILQPDTFRIEFEKNLPTCGSTNGAIIAHVLGGNSPYNYLWSPNQSTDSIISGIASGVDTLLVTDQMGCQITSDELLENSGGFNVTPIVLSNVKCFPYDLGSATVLTSGGTPPYSYYWNSNVNSNDTIYNLPADHYSVVVKDASGCIKKAVFDITSAPELEVYVQTLSATSDTTYDGQAKAIVLGGYPPYTLNWSNQLHSDSISNLHSGTDTIIVIDSKGCVDTAVFKIIVRPINLCDNCGPSNSYCGLFPSPTCPTPCLLVTKNIKINFGAFGDGLTNDECAFEAAASYFSNLPPNVNKILEFPPGTYIVGRQNPFNGFGLFGATVLCFNNINNLQLIGKLVGGDHPIIKFMDCMKYGAFDFPTQPDIRYLGCDAGPCALGPNNYNKIAYPGEMIHFNGCNNIAIKNIELDGNLDNAIIGGGYTEGIQQPYDGIFLNACSNIQIDNMNVHDFGHDGMVIYFMYCPSSATFPPQYPPRMNCNISNSKFILNGRNGLTWGGGIGLNVSYSEFNLTGIGRIYSKPGAGIDIEFEQSNVDNAEGTFTKCQIMYNKAFGISNNAVQNGTSLFSYNYKFIDCTIIGSETGYSVWPNARGFSFDRCAFSGQLVSCYNSTLSYNNLNNTDNARFINNCLFNEEYTDPYIYPITRKSFAPTPDENGCAVPHHQEIVNFPFTMRTYFDHCTFNTNYRLKLLELSHQLFLDFNPTIASYNLNRISNCTFRSHGLNSCACDWELTHIDYTDFRYAFATIQTPTSGIRNPPIGGCGSLTRTSGLADLFNCDRFFLDPITRMNWYWQPEYINQNYDPIAIQYTDPPHANRVADLFWCSPCPSLRTVSYPSCESSSRKRSLPDDTKSSLTLSPNPTTEKIQIKFGNGLLLKIQNAIGIVLFEKNIISEEFEVDLTNYIPGIYIFNFNNGVSSKIIKM